MGDEPHNEDVTEDAPGSTPERTCAVTRAKLPPEALIRFVRAPDGTITPDLARKLPGRGVWVALDRATVERAASQNAFARSLKSAVTVPAGLADLVETLLVRRAVAALALANKAGLVVSGFAKVEAAVASGRLAALIHASEASEDGCGKLDRKLRAMTTEGSPAPSIVALLEGNDLSLALGRPNVVHAALNQGGAARYFLNEIDRLRRYRSSTTAADRRPAPLTSNTEQV